MPTTAPDESPKLHTTTLALSGRQVETIWLLYHPWRRTCVALDLFMVNHCVSAMHCTIVLL